MTGSKSVVSLFNRFGQSIGDETVRRMDMSFQEAVNQNDTILPSHIQIFPNLSTGLAWDNFDINIETLSGENTIHHTYGICYQILCHLKTTNFNLMLKRTQTTKS